MTDLLTNIELAKLNEIRRRDHRRSDGGSLEPVGHEPTKGDGVT